MVEPDQAEGRTTGQVIADWRARMLFAPPQTLAERLLDYSLPALWVLALVAGIAAIFW